MKKNYKLLICIGLCVLFLSLTFMISKNTINPNKIEIPKISVDEWISETRKDQYIVTVIGSSTCPHCQEYKPIIAKESVKHKFKMYFFEGDTLNSDENSKLISSYEGMEHEYIPFTVITKKGKIIYTIEGSLNEKEIEKMLKENGVI